MLLYIQMIPFLIEIWPIITAMVNDSNADNSIGSLPVSSPAVTAALELATPPLPSGNADTS
jgi:hypothetical protein